MTDITENNDKKINIRDKLIRDIIVTIILFLFLCCFDYLALFKIPTYSVLSCHKNFINQTSCELGESYILDRKLHTKAIGNLHKVSLAIGDRYGTILLKTNIPLWGSSIQNIYFPSQTILSIPLNVFRNRAKKEVQDINNYINQFNSRSELNIVRKMSLFSIFTYAFLIFILFTNFPFVVVILILRSANISDIQER